MAITIRENMFQVFRHEVPSFLPMIHDIQNIATIEPGFTCWLKDGGKPGNYDTDWFGQGWVFEPMVKAYNPDASNYVIKDITKWREYVTLPDPDQIDWETNFKKDDIKVDRDNKFIMLKDGFGLWERAFSMVPIVDLLCALKLEPEACEDFFSAIADYKIKLHS